MLDDLKNYRAPRSLETHADDVLALLLFAFAIAILVFWPTA